MSGSRFDTFQNNMFDRVTSLYGFDASWNNLTAKVLLKEPTEKDMMNGVEYAPFHRVIEWRAGYFDGLFEAVRDGIDLQELIIDGREYIVAHGTAKWDGRTYRAVVELKNPNE